MASFNKVILMGNLTRDPELRSIPSGAPVCNFDLAMNRLKDGKGNLEGRVEEIRKLGAKTSRQIPQDIVDKAAENGALIEPDAAP